ncbi:MAG: FMN-binding protein [Clostridia bacterium]|nr:FMN-binding protein [Clostridia bacterium]
MNKTRLIPLLGLSLALVTACAAQPAPAPTQAPTTQPTASPTMQPTNVPTASPAQGSLMDGEYVAEMSETYAQKTGQGWQEYVKLTVSDGQIIDMEYDALKDGQRKSETTQEEYPMTPHPSQWIPQLNENLQAADNPDEVDAVAGATQSSQAIKKLYKAALEAARMGDEQAAIVE